MTVGMQLKNVREEKNISLKDIADVTNIKVDYLAAIERDELHKLPTIIHAKGFVRSYANYLGLDGLSFSKEISVAMHISDKDASSKVELSQVKSAFSWKNVKAECKEQFLRYKKELVWVLITLVCIFFIYKAGKSVVLFVKDKAANKLTETKKVTKPDAPAKKEEAVQIQETAVAVPEVNSSQSGYPVGAEELRLEAYALSKVWIAVSIDGELVYEGLLQEQMTEFWEAKDNISLRIGNAGGLKLILNGRDLGSLGKKGEVIKNLVLTKNGMEIR